MIIKFLQAGNGDCIYLSGEGHHVIVDSGESCPELVDVVRTIRQVGKTIDLLVITHYDSDHIKAICEILRELTPVDRKSLVKKVWFNATKVGFHGNTTDLSATDATDLASLLLEADIPWVSEVKKGSVEEICENLTLEVLDGGTIYRQEEGGKPLSNVKCDWKTSLSELDSYLDDRVLDKSETNSQSMILVAHIGGHQVLLPGDAVPNKLLTALNEFGKHTACHFDLVKMPHHGSYKNITKDILNRIICSDYVITTDGSVFCHPNKKMMLKVAKWGHVSEGRQITFHLNYYDTLKPQIGITTEEEVIYKIAIDGKRTFEF